MDYYFIHWFNDIGEDECKFFRYDRKDAVKDYAYKLRKRAISFNIYFITVSDSFDDYKGENVTHEF